MRRIRNESPRKTIASITFLILAAAARATWAQESPIIPVTGNERLAWDQAAPSLLDLARLEHVVHVDGSPVAVDELECTSTPGTVGYLCSSRLPAMAPGDHAISVATRFRGSVPAASAMSTVLRVRVSSSANIGATRSADSTGHVSVTRDGVRLRRTTLAAIVDDPTDMAALPDGRVLIAQRGGSVLVLRNGVLEPSPALQLADGGDGVALLALAADRDFETSREVYALYRDDRGLTVARFTESNGRLVNRAVILEGLRSSGERPMATLRMGADRKLYVALEHDAPGGQLLRLNRDGTTPDDQQPIIPVIAGGVDHPSSMDSTDRDRTIWLAGLARDGTNRVRAMRFDSNARRVVAIADYAVPADFGRLSVTSFPHDAVPAFRDSLFIAGEKLSALLRATFDRSGVPISTEWIFRGAFDSIQAITPLPDGSILVASAHQLIRISIDH